MIDDLYPKIDPAVWPSVPKPIKDSTFRKLLVLFGIKITRCFQKRSSPIFVLAPKICVKSGTFRDLAEASTMQFIGKYTTIPVPKIYCAFSRKGITYIVMEKIKGKTLESAWKYLSEESRESLLLQLKSLVNQMRGLPAPDEKVANVNGGSLWDCRLPSGLDRFGPFENIQDFHQYLRSGIQIAPPGYPEIGRMIDFQNRDCGNPIFTHGNLSSLNILVRGEKIVGLVDWENAGFLPEYWEYTTAHQINLLDSFWIKHIDRFLDPWPEALEVEKIRQRWWGHI